jgi:hypothetical protein
MLRQPTELFQEEIHRPPENRLVRAFEHGCHGAFTQAFLEPGSTDALIAHPTSPAEVPTSEFVVVLHRHFTGDGLCEAPKVSHQAAIEGQEKRPAMVVRSRVGQVKSAVYRHRGFSTSGSAQHDYMALRRQVKHLLLAADGLRQAHGPQLPLPFSRYREKLRRLMPEAM